MTTAEKAAENVEGTFYGRATLTFRDQLGGVLVVYRRLLRRMAPWLVGASVAGAAALVAFNDVERRSLLFFFALGVLLLGAFTLVVACSVMPFVSTWIMWSRMTDGQKALTYAASTDGMRMKDADGNEGFFPWATVPRMERARTLFVFDLKPAGHRWIPLRAFAPTALEAIEGWYRSRQQQ